MVCQQCEVQEGTLHHRYFGCHCTAARMQKLEARRHRKHREQDEQDEVGRGRPRRAGGPAAVLLLCRSACVERKQGLIVAQQPTHIACLSDPFLLSCVWDGGQGRRTTAQGMLI